MRSVKLPGYVVVLVCCLTLLLVACGGETSENGQDPTATLGDGDVEPDSEGVAPGSGGTESENELEQAALDLFSAFLEADDQAYFNALSRDCRETFEFAAVQAHVSGRRFNATNFGNVDLTALDVAEVTIASFDGSSGQVSLTIIGTDSAFQESLPHRWIYEEGAWRMDDCAGFEEAQGDLEGEGKDRNAPLGRGFVADAHGWLVSTSYLFPDGDEMMIEMGVEPPSSGNQLFAVQIGITYNGAETSAVVSQELAFAMVSGSTVYGDESSCDPDQAVVGFDPDAPVGPGEQAGNPILCREVATSEVDGLLLRMTHVPTGDEYWFDLSGA